tara:strand:- start:3388 stop:3777 length:390 start_codon:yes stop_codon:yes gene_type:complete
MATETPQPNDAFETVSLLVEVRRRLSDDAVYSSHRPSTPGDLKRLQEWPSGGLIQTSHALLIETLRREAYTTAITIMSQGSAPQDLTVEKVDETIRGHLIAMIAKFSPGVSQDIVEQIQEATPDAPGEE